MSAGDNADLIQCSNLWAQSAMNTQDFAVDNGSKGQEVEDLTAGLPYRSIAVLGLTLFVEAVDLSDLSGFVVSAY